MEKVASRQFYYSCMQRSLTIKTTKKNKMLSYCRVTALQGVL